MIFVCYTACLVNSCLPLIPNISFLGQYMPDSSNSTWPISNKLSHQALYLPHLRQLSFLSIAVHASRQGKTTGCHMTGSFPATLYFTGRMDCSWNSCVPHWRQLSFCHASRQGRRHKAIWVAAFTATSYITVRIDSSWNLCLPHWRHLSFFVHCSSCEPAGKTTCGHLGCGIHGNFIFYCQNEQFLEPLFATLTAVKLFVHCSSCEPAGKTTRCHLGGGIHGGHSQRRHFHDVAHGG